MPASCRRGTAFPQEQVLPGSRADPQIRIFTQVHEDSVKKLPVLAEAEPCAAMPGQRMTDKRIGVAGQIANDVFPHTGVFDASINETNLICPIPQKQIDVNPKLTQNDYKIESRN